MINNKKIKRILGNMIFISYFIFIIYKSIPYTYKLARIETIYFCFGLLAGFCVSVLLTKVFWYLIKIKYFYEENKVKFSKVLFGAFLFCIAFLGFNGIRNNYFSILGAGINIERIFILSIVIILRNNYKIIFFQKKY